MTISGDTLLLIVFALLLLVPSYFFGGASALGRFLLVAGTCIAGIFWSVTRQRIAAAPWWRNPDVLLGAFFLVTILSVFFSPIPQKTGNQIAEFALFIVVYFLARSLSSKQRLWLAGAGVAAGLLASLYALYAFFLYHNSTRLYGFFQNSDGLGAALLLPLILNVGLIASVQHRWQKITLMISVVILGTSYLLASAFASFVGLLVAFLLGWLLLRLRITRRVAAGGIALLLVIVLLSIMVRSNVITREASIPAYSTGELATGFQSTGSLNSLHQRWSFVRSSIAMANHAPLTGVGFGTWVDHFPQYQRSLIEWSSLAHGLIPQYVGELGWLGLAIFAWFLVSIFLTLVLVGRRPEASAIEKSGIIGVGALMIAGLIDIPLFYPSIFFGFWLFAGVLVRPATRELQPQAGRIAKGSLAVLMLLLLIWGGARFVSSYLANQAEAAAKAGNGLDALATADLTMRMFPDPQEEYRMAALQLVGSKFQADKDLARIWAERALRDNPLQPANYLLLGREMKSAGNAQRAEELFREGLRVDPHFYPDLAIDLAKLLLDQKRNAEAKEVALTMLSAFGGGIPSYATSMSTVSTLAGVAELELGEKDAAHIHLRDALKQNKDNEEAKTLLKAAFNESP